MGRIMRLSGGMVLDVDDKYTRDHLDQRLERAKAGEIQMFLHPSKVDRLQVRVDADRQTRGMIKNLATKGLDVKQKREGHKVNLEIQGPSRQIQDVVQEYGYLFPRKTKVQRDQGIRWW